MTETDGLARVRADAAARGIRIEIVERPAASSLEEAASLLGLVPSAIVKSLVTKRHDGSCLFALVPGGRRVSWRKLRRVVGVNRLRLADADAALGVTGYEPGTITPFGSATALPVIIDESAVGQRIAMGSGAHGYSLFVDADDVIAAFSATVADISDPEFPSESGTA